MCVYLCNRVPACAGQAGALRAAVPFGKPSAHSLEQLEAAREAWEVVLRIEPDNGDADLQMALVETEMAAAVGGGGYAAVVHAAHTTGTAYTHGSSGAAGLPSRFGGMVQRGPASSGRSPLCSVLERLERARLRSAADTPALLLHTAACLLRLEMAEAPVEPLPLLLPSRAEFALAEAAEEAAELRAAAEARAAAAAAAVAADDPLGLEAGEGLSADEILAAAIDGRVLSLPADPRPASDRDEAEPLAARLETEEGGGEGGGGEGGADASTARCVVSSVLGARPAAERALRAAQLLRVSLALQPSSSAAALLGVAVAWSVPRPCGALDTYIHTYIHARIRTYVHTYIHACIHTYLHTYIHTRIRTYIHACIPPYIHGYLHTVLPRPSIRNVAIPS